jgi:hypothetical protein
MATVLLNESDTHQPPETLSAQLPRESATATGRGGEAERSPAASGSVAAAAGRERQLAGTGEQADEFRKHRGVPRTR